MIKDYQYWTLSLHSSQAVLGNALISCKRSLRDFSGLTPEEMLELQTVIQEYERALLTLFKPKGFHYLQDEGQLQFQALPEYQKTPLFTGDVAEVIQRALLEVKPEKKSPDFYFVISGETSWKEQWKIEGHSSLSLNRTGVEQTRQLQEAIRGEFESCYASDLPRAVETAEILMKASKGALIKDPRLRDRDYGNWDGRSFADFKRARPEELAGVETLDAVKRRLFEFLNEVATVGPEGQNVLIVTHSGIMKLLIAHLLGFAQLDAEIGVIERSLVKISRLQGHWRIAYMDQIILPRSIVFA